MASGIMKCFTDQVWDLIDVQCQCKTNLHYQSKPEVHMSRASTVIRGILNYLKSPLLPMLFDFDLIVST